MTQLAPALALLVATGCAPVRAEPSAAASAAAHAPQALVPGIVAPRYLSVEDLRRLDALARDRRANRRAFGKAR